MQEHPENTNRSGTNFFDLWTRANGKRHLFRHGRNCEMPSIPTTKRTFRTANNSLSF